MFGVEPRLAMSASIKTHPEPAERGSLRNVRLPGALHRR